MTATIRYSLAFALLLQMPAVVVGSTTAFKSSLRSSLDAHDPAGTALTASDSDGALTGANSVTDAELRSVSKSPDSSAIFLRDFLKQAGADATTCNAETPLIRFGDWGLHAYPLPYYQEEHGWEFGSMVSLLRGGPIESPYSLSVMTTYGEREDKLYGFGALKIGTSPGKPLGFSSTLRAENRHGRRGLSALLGLSRSAPDHGAWISVEVLLGHESYRSIRYLDQSEWETGDRTMGGVRFKYDDFGHEKLRLLGLQADLSAVTAQDLLGGDFVNRRLSVDIRFASNLGMVWAAAGSIGGNAPIQEHFDLAVVGGIRAGSIRTYQTTSFWALGLEGRIQAPIGLFALPYVSMSGGENISGDLQEFGIGFNDSSPGPDYNPSDWFIRFDIPIYSNAGIDSSRRAKWDLRRIMVRINLPLDFASRREGIRYRYPNR